MSLKSEQMKDLGFSLAHTPGSLGKSQHSPCLTWGLFAKTAQNFQFLLRKYLLILV